MLCGETPRDLRGFGTLALLTPASFASGAQWVPSGAMLLGFGKPEVATLSVGLPYAGLSGHFADLSVGLSIPSAMFSGRVTFVEGIAVHASWRP